MRLQFLIGEHSLAGLGNEPPDSPRIHSFVALLDAAGLERTLAWEELFEVPVDGYASLSEFLFGPDAKVDRDLRILLGVQLQRIQQWGDEEGAPDVSFTDGSQTVDFAPSIGLCAMNVSKEPWALLCLQGTAFSGLTTLRSTEGTSNPIDIWFAEQPSALVEFSRDAITRYDVSEQQIEDFASDAFPRTTFAPTVWTQLNRFEGKWLNVRPLLVEVLSGLDDGVVKVFGQSVQSHERSALMQVQHGVDCSPESPNTRRNVKAMSQRKAGFADRVRVCEWHAKLEPHRNRVHFTIENDTLYVGIFAKHLLT